MFKKCDEGGYYVYRLFSIHYIYIVYIYIFLPFYYFQDCNHNNNVYTKFLFKNVYLKPLKVYPEMEGVILVFV